MKFLVMLNLLIDYNFLCQNIRNYAILCSVFLRWKDFYKIRNNATNNDFSACREHLKLQF